MFRRPKSPKVLRLFLWFDIFAITCLFIFSNPVMLHKCGFIDGPGIGFGAQPIWYDRTMILTKPNGKFVLDATTADESYEGYNDWVKGGQQLKTITGYGFTLPHEQTVYLKATDWDNIEHTFALTEYEGPSDYVYELSKLSTAKPADVWWWVITDLRYCQINGINYIPLFIFAFICLCFINLILRGTHAFDLPVRVLKWAAINRMPDDKAGRRR